MIQYKNKIEQYGFYDPVVKTYQNNTSSTIWILDKFKFKFI